MIIDTLDRVALYRRLSPAVSEALHFLRTNDLKSMPDGRCELESDIDFAIVQTYETKPAAEKRWEAHRKFVDLQFVITGTEWMGYAPLETLTPVEPYDAEKDIAWYQGEGSFVRLPAGSFCILTPNDAHMPGVCVDSPQTVRKIVIKIAATAWSVE